MRTRYFVLGNAAILAVIATGLVTINNRSGAQIAQAQGTAVSTPASTVAGTVAATMAATMAATTLPVVTMDVPRSSSGDSYVAVVNAAANTTTLNVLFGGRNIATNLKFGDSTDYMTINAGSNTLDARNGSNLLYTTTISLAPGTSALVVALGGGGKHFKLTTVPIQRGPTLGKARVEFFHAIPDAPTVDVLQDKSPVLTQIKFGHLSDAPLNLIPNIYDFALVPTGKTIPSLLELAGTSLKADTIYTIVAIGTVGNKTARVVIITSTSPMPNPTPQANATGVATNVATP